MTKAEFLRFDEAVYRLYTSKDWVKTIRTLIPCSYFAFFPTEGRPLCFPESTLWQNWLFWQQHSNGISPARRTGVLWDAEGWESPERRQRTDLYQKVYREYDIFDGVTLTLAQHRRPLGRVLLLRTRAEGGFLPQEVFFLQRLSRHLPVSRKFHEEVTMQIGKKGV